MSPPSVGDGSEDIIRFRTRKAAVLMAYLALNPGPHDREFLANLLWPGTEREASHNSLRVCLSFLRSQFGLALASQENLLWLDRYTVELNPDAFTSDIKIFQNEWLLAEQNLSEQKRETRITHLDQMFSLYRGRLLKGYFEKWAEPPAIHLETLFVRVAHELISHDQNRGEIASAIKYASAAARLVPDQIRFTERLWELESNQKLQSNQKLHTQSPTLIPPAPSLPFRQQSSQSVAHLPASPKTVSISSTRLPMYATPFWGREQEITHLVSSLKNEEVMSLVTLVGPPGIGKTRLAVQAALKAMEEVPATVLHFVSLSTLDALSTLDSSNLVAESIRIALDLSPNSQADPLKQIVQMLRHECEQVKQYAQGQVVLFLDNLEHLLPEAAITIQLLRSQVPQLKIWATSRSPLRLPGEELLLVGALPLPAANTELKQIQSVPSIQLFSHRARAARPDFSVTDTNATALIQLCQWLQGWPLALEVAASHSNYFTPAQMLEQLEAQPQFLLSGKSESQPESGLLHTQSLQNAISWSYRLLSQEAAHLFISLAVFRGGANLELIKAIGGDERALYHLTELVSHSLVICEERHGELRYSLLEGIRQFAHEQRSQGQWEQWRQRHAYALRGVVVPTEVRHIGKSKLDWMERLDVEIDNIRLALEWSDQHDEELLLHLSSSLGTYWEVRGLYSEGSEWLGRVLAKPEVKSTIANKRAKVEALNSMTRIHFARGEFSQGQERAREAAILASEINDKVGLAESRLQEGKILLYQGQLLAASQALESSRAMFESAHYGSGEAHALVYLGFNNIFTGAFDETYEYYQRAVERARNAGDLTILALSLFFCGDVMGPCGGRYADAKPHFEESLQVAILVNDYIAQAYALWGLCRVAIAQGHLDDAQIYLAETKERSQRAVFQFGQAFVLEAAALLASAQGKLQRAALLMGAAEVARTRLTLPITSSYVAEFQRQLASLWDTLDSQERIRFWSYGRTLSLAEALEFTDDVEVSSIRSSSSETAETPAEASAYLGFPLELEKAKAALVDSHIGGGRLAYLKKDGDSAKWHFEQALRYARETENSQKEKQILERLNQLSVSPAEI